MNYVTEQILKSETGRILWCRWDSMISETGRNLEEVFYSMSMVPFTFFNHLFQSVLIK